MICTLCNDAPGEGTVVALERRDGGVKEVELALCEECEIGLTAEDWIDTGGTPVEL